MAVALYSACASLSRGSAALEGGVDDGERERDLVRLAVRRQLLDFGRAASDFDDRHDELVDRVAERGL